MPARRLLSLLVPLLLVGLAPIGAGPAVAADPPPAVIPGLEGADLTRPRITLRAGDITMVRSRLDRDPYRRLVDEVQDRAEAAPAPDPSHQADCVQTANRDREAAKARAARNLSFLYLVDRVRVPGTGEIVEPTDEQRQQLGDTVRDYLRFMCTESRIKIDPDRDINTSHELLQLASAYDNLVAGGYDLGAHEDVVVENLVDLTSEYYEHYTRPNYVGQFLVNNHLSKGAAAIGVAALALAEYQAPAGTDPAGIRDPARWLDFALDRVDEVQRWTYGAGDGGYGEGPHYWRFSAINLYPFLRAWHSIHPAPWTTADGVTVPDLWTHPQFLAMQRWLLDHTLPDGTLAPTDDNKVGERMFWGAAPASLPELGAYYRTWLDGPGPYGNTASIDLTIDEIVSYHDSVPTATPTGSPTRFYPEGGSAVFRSDWSEEATMAIVLGEHGAAREFGRTREGVGQPWGAPHDHADPGSFLLHAHGERLLMDPGYRDYPWTLQWTLNKPSSHNMILVGPDPADPSGESPNDPLTSSVAGVLDPSDPRADWLTTPGAALPLDGNATVHGTFDAGFVDTSTVTARYGAPAGSSALVERRFLFLDDAYLVVLDDVSSPIERTYTWPLHGNGGGVDGTRPAQPALNGQQRPPLGADALPAEDAPASGGTFTQTASGGEWSRPRARVTVGMAVDGEDRTSEVALGYYEQTRSRLGSYDILRTSATGTDVRASSVLYPTPSSQDPPTISEVAVAGANGLLVEDPGGDRRVLVLQASTTATGDLTSDALGFPVSTDGDLLVVDTHTDGRIRSLYAEHATTIDTPPLSALGMVTPGRLGVQVADDGTVEVVTDGGTITVSGPMIDLVDPSAAVGTDGACSADLTGSPLRYWVDPGADGRARVGTIELAGRPSAALDPPIGSAGVTTRPSETRAAVGTTVRLDGLESCDVGSAIEDLTPTWEILSAPAGSSWTLVDPTSWEPGLLLDAPGPYRVQLTVTDGDGRASLPVETRYVAGDGRVDGEDGDLDGWFDTADSDADGLAVAGLPAAPGSPTFTLEGDEAVVTWTDTGDPAAGNRRYRVTLGSGELQYVTALSTSMSLPRHRFGNDPVTVAARNSVGWGPEAISGPPPPYCDASRFSDVPGTHPFCTDITWIADDAITTGHSDGTYRPQAPVTRGAMAAFLHRAAGRPLGDHPTCTEPPFPDVPTTHPFPDVPTTHPFCAEIAWAADQGITTGHPDGTYRPDTPVTRGAMAAFLHRAAGRPLGDHPTCGLLPIYPPPPVGFFPDVPTTHPFCAEIAWAADEGIAAGHPDGTYRPQAPVTRGAMAAFLHRAANN